MDCGSYNKFPLIDKNKISNFNGSYRRVQSICAGVRVAHNILDSAFCIRALLSALGISQPVIFNTDQGSQFTSLDFTTVLKERGIKISMDGKGRAIDNVFIERLWRSVKYELIYLKEFDSVPHLYDELNSYFKFYNAERHHQALGNRRPAELYPFYNHGNHA